MWLRPLSVLTLLGLVGLACATKKNKSRAARGASPGAGAGAGAERIVDPEAMSSEANKTVDILKDYRRALQKDKDQGSSEPLDVSKRRDDTIDSLNAVLDGPGDTVESFMDLYSASDADISELCSPFDNAPEEAFSATSLDKDSFIKEASSVLSDWDGNSELLGFAMDRSSTYPARGALIAALDSYVSSAKPVSADAFKAWTNEVWSEKSSHWLDLNSSLAKKAAICADGGSEFFANSSEATLQSKGGRGGLVFSIILGTMVAGVVAGLGVEKWQRRGSYSDGREDVIKEKFRDEYDKLITSYNSATEIEAKKALLGAFNARWGTEVKAGVYGLMGHTYDENAEEDTYPHPDYNKYTDARKGLSDLEETQRLQKKFVAWVKKYIGVTDPNKVVGYSDSDFKRKSTITLGKSAVKELEELKELKENKGGEITIDDVKSKEFLLYRFAQIEGATGKKDLIADTEVTDEMIEAERNKFEEVKKKISHYSTFEELVDPTVEYYGGKTLKERRMMRGAIGAAGGLLVGVGIGAVVGALGLAGEGQDHLSQLSERYKRRLGAILASVARKRRNARRGW